ncbi:MAG: hypothetical protein ABGZ17_00115 [Planctomycetaceae bacterium]
MSSLNACSNKGELKSNAYRTKRAICSSAVTMNKLEKSSVKPQNCKNICKATPMTTVTQTRSVNTSNTYVENSKPHISEGPVITQDNSSVKSKRSSGNSTQTNTNTDMSTMHLKSLKQWNTSN